MKPKALEIAEYFSIAASAIVAIASPNPAYTAAPLTLALGLNVVNRRQYQQQLHDEISGRLVQTERTFQNLNEQIQTLPNINNELNSISQEFKNRPEKVVIEESKIAIAQLTDQLKALVFRVDSLATTPDSDLNRIGEEISNIDIRIDNLTRLLNERSDSQGIEESKEAIRQVTNWLENLSQEFNHRPEPQVLDLFQTAIAQLTEQFNAMALRLDQLSATPDIDLSSVEAEITNINGKLDELTIKVDNSSTSPNVDLSEIEQAVANLSSHLDGLYQQFNNRPEPQVINELSAQINGINSRLVDLPTSSEPELTGFEQAIIYITGQVDEMRQQFNNRPETQTINELTEQLNVINSRLTSSPTPPEIDLGAIENIITQLATQLDELNQQFNTRPETQVISELTEQLNSINSRLASSPTPPETDLSGVEEAIVQLASRLDELNQQFNTRPETEVISELTEQLNSINSRLASSATPPETDLSGVEEAIVQLASRLDELNQQFNTRPETEVISELTQQFNSINSRLVEERTPGEFQLSGVEEGIAQLASQLDELSQQFNTRPETQIISELTQQINTINSLIVEQRTPSEVQLSGIAQLVAQVEGLQAQFNNRSEAQGMEQLQIVEQALVDIYEQINALNLRLDLGENYPHIQEESTSSEGKINDIYSLLDSALIEPEVEPRKPNEPISESQIDGTISPINDLTNTQNLALSEEEQAIADIANQIEALKQQFNNQPETAAIKQLQTEIVQTQKQLSSITLRLSDLPTFPDVNLNTLTEVFTNIHIQFNSLNQQINSRPEIQSIEQLGEAITQLTDQLTALIFNPDTPTTPLEKEAIDDIHFQLNAMALCMDNLPTPPNVNLSGVNRGIVQINNHLDTLNQQINSQVGGNAIDRLETAMGELIEEIDIVASHLDSLPVPSEIDFDGEEPGIDDLQW